MKTLSRSFLLIVSLLAGTVAFGAVPPMSVIVSDAAGQASFKGTTNADGTFATATLPRGNYVVQFMSKNENVKGKYYAVAISAGRKKVTASAVPGEKFSGGGIAMKVNVGSGLNITGQVIVNPAGTDMVWIQPMTGSNMPGHWVEKGSPQEIQSRARGILSKDRIWDMQNKGIGLGSG